MIETLFGIDALNTQIGLTIALLIGLAFGSVLELAGFGSSKKLTGIFYFTDMTVLKVMFAAVITAMLGMCYLFGLGLLRPESIHFLDTAYGPQIVGGLLFGVGFVVGGWCPGTAAVGFAAGRLDALIFLLGAVGGSMLFNEAYPHLGPLLEWGQRGVVFVYDSLDLPRPVFAFLFTLVAILSWWFAEFVEERYVGKPMGEQANFLWGFSMALFIAAFGLFNIPDLPAPAPRNPIGAAFPDNTASLINTVGAASSLKTQGQETSLLLSIDEGLDHIAPEALAGRLMNNEPGLVVVDIRSPAEFAEFHLRGAVNIRLVDLPYKLAPYQNKGTIILYSNGMTHPAQARDALFRLGFQNVLLLTDGLDGFIQACLKPVSLRSENVSPTLAQSIQACRAYFLPQP